MTNLSVTAASVRVSEFADIRNGTAGETLTAGLAVYISSSDGKLYKADATTLAKSRMVGICLNSAAVDQPANYVAEDRDFTPGGTMVSGSVYVLSATAGGGNLAPFGDHASGMFPVRVMVATSTTKAKLKILAGTVVY